MNALTIVETRPLEVPELTTARLVLKAPDENVIPRMVELADNRAVAENLGTMPHPYTQDSAHEWMAGKTNSNASDYRFAIYLNIPEPAFIGIIGFRVPDKLGQSEIGYWIGEPYWGRGYASEAVLAILDHGFSIEGLSQMQAECRITNMGSRRVLEKCGFEYRGFAKRHNRALGEDVPVDCFALSKPRFKGLQIRRNGRIGLRGMR
ncbi:MAG: GNAT family N-acetyltransferase [Hyphomicrobiales bacterium]